MYENTFPSKRYKHTIEFLKEVVPNTNVNILDLGVRNPFVDFMEREGYTVQNTTGEDLDLDTTAVQKEDYDVLTAFEIFEHLLSPFHVVKDVKATKIVASIPLKLWFSEAYQSKTDPWDRHYHEFEDWQFDWVFEKAGWEIKKRQKFTNPVKKLGIRPLLRLFTPRYYLIYAEKKS
ncbi:methyltransferase [uncultured Dokdonia sp.]|uniref:methyltransferase n=1 Tax=uncultured Dokdonia sp. TaxID=575653 RepID=UPI0026054AA9|nr:methyltransferase [uncultured Dokdonia sp.]